LRLRWQNLHTRCDRKQAEEDLKQSERKFRAILDSTFELMGLLSVEGIVVEVNQTALDAIGADHNITSLLNF
jgi:PAS domain-containing protein